MRRLGAADSPERTPAQTEAAWFWAAQSTQRSFAHLAVGLTSERPLPDGTHDEARLLAALTVALGDSAMSAWQEKGRHCFWRPVTALAEGSPGEPAVPGRQPLVETPPHPDHPSGHASDCGTGAEVLSATFGATIPVAYTGIGRSTSVARRFERLSDVPLECPASRTWAGVHFRAANDEGLRLGREIVGRALAAVPPVGEPPHRERAVERGPR